MRQSQWACQSMYILISAQLMEEDIYRFNLLYQKKKNVKERQNIEKFSNFESFAHHFSVMQH